MEVIVIDVEVLERRSLVQSEFERYPFEVSDAVASAVAELTHGTKFPDPVAGGPSAMVVAQDRLRVEIPISVDEASPDLLALLEGGFDADEPLDAVMNGAFQNVFGSEEIYVEVLSCRPVS